MYIRSDKSRSFFVKQESFFYNFEREICDLSGNMYVLISKNSINGVDRVDEILIDLSVWKKAKKRVIEKHGRLPLYYMGSMIEELEIMEIEKASGKTNYVIYHFNDEPIFEMKINGESEKHHVIEKRNITITYKDGKVTEKEWSRPFDTFLMKKHEWDCVEKITNEAGEVTDIKGVTC